MMMMMMMMISYILGYGHKFQVLKSRMLRKISGCKGDELNGKFRTL
jgi:hypothetical protein